MKIETNDIDQVSAALGLLDREVWIVTAAADSGPLAPRAEMPSRGGLLATWVAPASIDRERPVLLAAIAPIHFTAELIDASRAFAAHLLREDQIDLAWNFARDSGRDRDKLAGCALETRSVSEEANPPLETRSVSEGVNPALETRSVSEGVNPSSAGPPVLTDCLAWFTCRVIARLGTGDRLYYWADITASKQLAPGPPLRQQTLFRSLTPDQRAHLAACQRTDAESLRPRHEAWRQAIAARGTGVSPVPSGGASLVGRQPVPREYFR